MMNVLEEPLYYRLLGQIITISNIMNERCIEIKCHNSLLQSLICTLCEVLGVKFERISETKVKIENDQLVTLMRSLLDSTRSTESIMYTLKLDMSSTSHVKVRLLVQGLTESTGRMSNGLLTFKAPRTLTPIILHYLRLDGFKSLTLSSKGTIKLNDRKEVTRFLITYAPILPYDLSPPRYCDEHSAESLRYWLLGFSLVRAILKEDGRTVRYYIASSDLASKLLHALSVFNASISVATRIEVASAELYEWISNLMNAITKNVNSSTNNSLSKILDDRALTYLLRGVSEALLNNGNHVFRRNIFLINVLRKILEARLGKPIEDLNDLITVLLLIRGVDNA